VKTPTAKLGEICEINPATELVATVSAFLTVGSSLKVRGRGA
jgi:hypothetical protein